MHPTTLTATGPAGSRCLHQHGYGVPSPALVARADRGFERFLARTTQADTAPTDRHDAARNR
ncbi:hypothetical protein [Streptomyces lavendofoliae]|uniref:Uncharacterized protein n=1 Tax=Streptomyces lavendofoliae TaxID=67314 RepID=A0A918I5D5_9ACTN|nr:hypothetical protein [Streptomyces lavendofoliae]GGU66385.1 hypothetical protein GCM10010274_63790 [Streptomyces lavendofoliae]